MVFRMETVRHLGFLKFNFLTVWEVERPMLHQRTKFGFVKNGQTVAEMSRSLWFFKMAAAAILYFQKFEILTIDRYMGPICVIVPNLIEIGQNIAEIWRFNGFSKWRPSAILDLLGAYWDHPWRPLDGLHRCAKFGRNRCRIFDNMKLSIFCPCGLKTGFRGISPSKWGAMSMKPPKGTPAGRSGSRVYYNLCLYL